MAVTKPINKQGVIFLKRKKEVSRMQMCFICDKVYDESEYVYCPYCSGELSEDDDGIMEEEEDV